MGMTLPNPLQPDDRTVRWWVWAVLISNIGIVLTGALVRLTGSGLGCPTWPKCTDESFVPHKELGVNGAIEFGNRLLTYVLIAVAIAAFVAIWRWSSTSTSLRQHMAAIALGIPFQGVIGGITVRTDLNPWVVALHLVLSMVLIAASVWLLMRVSGTRIGALRDPVVLLTYGLTWVVVYLGTVVTGSGPHAGDAQAPRNGLDPQAWSHIHAWAVYALVAATLLAIWRLRGTPAGRAALALLGVEVAQGVIGFVQYFNDLPIALVAAHMIGAAVLVATATHLLLADKQRSPELVDHDR